MNRVNGKNGFCPFCSSGWIVKAGLDYTSKGKNQRYLCHECHRITIKPIRQLELTGGQNEPNK